MSKLSRSILPNVLREWLIRIVVQLKNFKILASEYGQWSSIWHWKAEDKNSNPIPWYTYPAMEFLEHLDFSQMMVFEYGSGNSTLWWAERSTGIQSVEDDEVWYIKIQKKLKSNKAHYLLVTDKNEYIAAAPPHADVYVIDGSYRRACADHVAQFAGGVMIILDNADWFPETVEVLRSTLGWIQVDFHGFGPINGYTWTTTIFINPGRHHELVYLKKLGSLCGIKQVSSADKLN